MRSLIRDLIAHKGFANTALLDAIERTAAAVADPGITALLEHVRLANRFWLLTILGQPFDQAAEARPSGSCAALRARLDALQRDEEAWLERASDEDLQRTLESPLIPGGRCTVAEALVQVSMHAHGHRAQCATLLRRARGEPPATDFILWLPQRATGESPTS